MTNELIEWLRAKVGSARFTDGSTYDTNLPLIEHDWCGDTIGGFYSEFAIDWEKLEKEMDDFIKSLGAK